MNIDDTQYPCLQIDMEVEERCAKDDYDQAVLLSKLEREHRLAEEEQFCNCVNLHGTTFNPPFKLMVTPEDGNCLYHAVKQSIYSATGDEHWNNENNHHVLRRRAIEHINSNRAEFEQNFNTLYQTNYHDKDSIVPEYSASTFDQYLHHQAQNGVYSDELAIQALARVLTTDIIIVNTMNGNNYSTSRFYSDSPSSVIILVCKSNKHFYGTEMTRETNRIQKAKTLSLTKYFKGNITGRNIRANIKVAKSQKNHLEHMDIVPEDLSKIETQEENQNEMDIDPMSKNLQDDSDLDSIHTAREEINDTNDNEMQIATESHQGEDESGNLELNNSTQIEYIRITIAISVDKASFQYNIQIGNHTHMAEGDIILTPTSPHFVFSCDNQVKLTEAGAELQATLEALAWMRLAQEKHNWKIPANLILCMKRDFIANIMIKPQHFKGPLCKEKLVIRNLIESLRITSVSYEKMKGPLTDTNSSLRTRKNLVTHHNGEYSILDLVINPRKNATTIPLGISTATVTPRPQNQSIVQAKPVRNASGIDIATFKPTPLEDIPWEKFGILLNVNNSKAQICYILYYSVRATYREIFSFRDCNLKIFEIFLFF